jgi:hypothetical protein
VSGAALAATSAVTRSAANPIRLMIDLLYGVRIRVSACRSK